VYVCTVYIVPPPLFSLQLNDFLSLAHLYSLVSPALGFCLSLNKSTQMLENTPCHTKLSTICNNSASRRTTVLQDVTRQVAVNTSVGTIQGFRDQNSFRFLGIPYADAPIGDLRFAAPRAKAAFKTTLSATAFGHICPQASLPPSLASLPTTVVDNMLHGATEDEDCLYLNVFTPSLKAKGQKGLPVVVYFHGGGYIMQVWTE